MKINVSQELRSACPDFVGAAVSATVVNSVSNADLWNEIDTLGRELQSRYSTDDIKNISSIAATRQAYKSCGKDPSRYRPSGEQLMRRVLQGKELYRINTLVDLINLASMKFGYSIGGFDAALFQGDTLTLGIGRKDEPYEGIGRGLLNIEGLPVYRDAAGGVGTPTSDNERTKLRPATTRLLAIVNGYDGNRENVTANAEFIRELLCRYAASDGGEIIMF